MANRLAVKRSATGLGLFALAPIPPNKRIVEYRGVIISNEESLEIGGKYLFTLDDNRAIDGRSRDNIARYINHSCRPNAEAYTNGKRVWIWSARTIRAGEEITIDYGKEYLDEFIKPGCCKCEKCARKSKKNTQKKSKAR